jgi:hypothetical protein
MPGCAPISGGLGEPQQWDVTAITDTVFEAGEDGCIGY